MYVNLIGRTRRQQLRVDNDLKERGSLWPDNIPGLHTFEVPIWKYYLNKLFGKLYQKTKF